MSKVPAVAVIFTQPQCNMYCTFCITEDSFDCMTPEQGLDLLSYLKTLGVKTLVIGGGEPFFWPYDLLALTRTAKEMGFVVQVGTNAVALPEGYEKAESIDRFILPLESVESGPHNDLRRYENRHHEIIMDCLETLGRAGKSATISTVVTAVNKDHVVDVGRWLGEYHEKYSNIHAWHIYQFIPEGRGGSPNAANLEPRQGIYEEVIREAFLLNLPFRVYRRSNMYHSQAVEFYWFEKGRIVSTADTSA